MSVETRATVPVVAATPLDYYVIVDASGATAEAVAVEEFVRAPDWCTVGLDSAVWTPATGWRSSASFSRGMRADARLRARVRPVPRGVADAVHRQLGGGPLPGEPSLRDRFGDRQTFPAAAPLLLASPAAPEGCHERRVYRTLFAGDLPADRGAELAARWPAGHHAPAGVLAAGRRRVGGDDHTWALRRIGGGVAWAVDLTVALATAADHSVGPVLHELTTVVRLAGLIPATTERFA
ncbi:hypothetical protein AB0J20_17215 [Micromonospora costi]|uniref:hypothetical protein n=1 Tax=Micromonospora costi TaxID=1530042 RepID=UPI0033C9317A